ncbi:peptidase domain-containing ABC transporter [Kordiimonas aquimaris]|uniref:peptidase domain-containing ABC transporter n=1 Tax=Kordiimonas aquimaris TaxID=707591 RepID=UPI0021D097CF|nr:peptidase domain-containing ABC transporter [Kordiimonas aquimaris]
MNASPAILFGKRKLPILHQSEAAECGLACLAMVAAYHGYKTDLSALRGRFQVSLKGATLQNLMSVADQIGFAARPLRAELEALDTIQTPAILHWNMNHFVVLAKATKKHAIIHDPARGKLKLSLRDVSNHFTGVALELRPTPAFEPKEDVKPVKLTDFWGKISGLKRSMVQAFMLSAFLQVFALITPLYQQMVVDDAITKQDTDFLIVLAIGFGFMGVMNIAVTYLRSYVMLYFSSALNFQMTVNLFRHLMRLPVDFFERRHIGDITSRFGSLAPVGQLFTSGLVAVVLDGFMAIGTLAMAFIYSAKLTFVVLGFMMVGFAIELVAFPVRKRKNEEILHLGAKENSNFLETIRAVRAIKIFGQETARESVWQNLKVETLNANVSLSKFNINLGNFTSLIGVGQSIIVMYMGAILVIDGSMTLGMLFAYQAYSGQFSSRISALIGQFMSFKMLKLHLSRLADIVHTEPEVKTDENGTGSQQAIKLKGDIQLNNLCFRYGEQEPFVLKGVDLNIQAGEMIAITGASGGGKSTLLKVMLGLLKPQEGDIRIDGVPLSVMGPQAYRSNLGVVMQDDQLLSGSIADNISFFDPNLDHEKMELCARAAGIHKDIVKNPMGYNSLIGDMGTSLSGGQKQRIIIARALYRKPRILFLDEGTANLDEKTEQHITHVIERLPITRIIIAHRPALIEAADRVFAMVDGVLHEVPQQRFLGAAE